MSLQISRWNPFRFKRQAHGTPQSSGSSSGAAPSQASMSSDASGQARPQSAAVWPQATAMPGLMSPFNLVPGMLFNPFSGFGAFDRWFGDFSPGMVNPQLDVVDDGDALRITAELAGMDRDDIEVLLQDDILVIRGEKKQERKGDEKGCYRLERAFGSFQRVIPLPAGLDTDRAEATFDKSVLTIRIPKVPGTCIRQRQRKEDPDQVGAARRFPEATPWRNAISMDDRPSRK